MKAFLLFCLLAGVSFGQEKPTLLPPGTPTNQQTSGTSRIWNTSKNITTVNESLFVTQSACQTLSQIKIDFGSGPETVAKCEKGKWVRVNQKTEKRVSWNGTEAVEVPIGAQGSTFWQTELVDTPENLLALKHSVTCPVPYSSPAQLVHTDGYLREPNCLDPKHGFEWYCEDGARALQISQDGSKAWCHRGPQ